MNVEERIRHMIGDLMIANHQMAHRLEEQAKLIESQNAELAELKGNSPPKAD